MFVFNKSLKTFTLVCLSVMMECDSITIKNAELDELNLLFIEILKSLGVKINTDKSSITLISKGHFTLFKPEKEVDIKGREEILYALAGMLGGLDYNIFFTSSVKLEGGFSNLILGLYDVGLRFNYGKDFSLPIQMKGTSNLLPASHTLLNQNSFLGLSLVLLGLSGIGRTKITFPEKHEFFEKALQNLKANVRFDGNTFSLALGKKNKEEIILDLKNYE